MKNFKTRKQIFLDISLVIFICVLIVGIIFTCNRTIFVSTNTAQDNNTPIVIPNVTEDNITFKISDTKNKVESVNISATSRLDEYNLCYYIDFNTENPSEINNTDYSLLNDTILMIDENCTIYFKYELDGNYSSDIYEIKVSNIKISSETTEKVSDKELKEANVNKNEIKQQSTSPYFIKVNYGANVVTIYTKDEDGNYTVPYKAMVCSCGTYTPKSGTYKTTNKYAWRPLVHDVYGQYATRIVKKILFHSVPYSTNKKDALLYEEYDKLGTKASEGCVRLTVTDAKWIYDNCPSSTMVEFYSDSNPGPLGKPTAQKISSNVECRNWDPTDPAADNPWHTYKKEEEEKPSEDITTDIENNIINNNVNENINNTVDNSIDTNITNESTNNSVIDNNVVDNSSSLNNVITDTNSTVNNNTVDNSTIDNNTIDNSGASNDTANNDVTNNTTTDSYNNLDDTGSSDNSTSNKNVTTGEPGNSAQNNNDTDNNVNNQIVNNTAENLM